MTEQDKTPEQTATAETPAAPKKLSGRAIAASLGITPQAYSWRIRNGWTPEEASGQVKRQGKKRGKESLNDLCAAVGIARSTYYRRRAEGMSREEALAQGPRKRGRKLRSDRPTGRATRLRTEESGFESQSEQEETAT